MDDSFVTKLDEHVIQMFGGIMKAKWSSDDVPGRTSPSPARGPVRLDHRPGHVESLQPRTVISGHKRPDRADDPQIIEQTRRYIFDFDRIAETSSTACELYDHVLVRYPGRANPSALWTSARTEGLGLAQVERHNQTERAPRVPRRNHQQTRRST